MTRADFPAEPASTPKVNDSLQLRSLAPAYDPTRHGVYVDALVNAVARDDVRNIALTGPYGTGKSSILERLAAPEVLGKRVLQLSLSTVGKDESSDQTPADANPAAGTKTNLIQKEIVKQILYRDPPDRTPSSRFRRISRFRWRRELVVSFVGATALTAILFLFQALEPIASALAVPSVGLSPFVAYGAVLAALGAIVLAVRWVTHGRVFLERLTAGPATVSLQSSASSYFDQYMDEIVYYFEQSGRDIVVFEDIDRFDDVSIFETLRSLNTLLNGAEQVRRRRAPSGARGISWLFRVLRWSRPKLPAVKFIYALRDSIFEKLGSEVTDEDGADDEIRRANRTKFFDLVVPVVPFITHRNARDLMARTMEGTGVSKALVSLAAQHVADMRLITSMRNEYDIYASRLLDITNPMPGLDADKLFAVILYKSVHLADFEAIRFGKSKLDELHDAWREIVADSLASARDRARQAKSNLARGGFLEVRSRELGARLEVVVSNYVEPARADSWRLHFGGETYERAALRECEFWSRIIAEQPILKIHNSRNQQIGLLHFTQLPGLMGCDLDAVEWEKVDRRAEQTAARDADADITFLRHHSWKEIFQRPEFGAKRGNDKQETFADATSRLLSSRLARSLVAEGFLNDYFALYISSYYGELVRQEAQNYIVHALDQGKADVNYPLDGEDVEAIIDDVGTDIFRDRAAYNVNILDHLLLHRTSDAQLVIGQVAMWEDDDRAFVDLYMQDGHEQAELVRLLAAALPEILRYLIDDAPVSDSERVTLVDAALTALDPEIKYESPANLAGYVRANFEEFASLSSKDAAPAVARRSVDALARLGVRVPDTSVLNPPAQERVIDHGAYDVTPENLMDLTGGSSIALDTISHVNSAVHETILSRLAEYVAALDHCDGARSVDDADAFVTVIHDVDGHAGHDSSIVTAIVRHAVDNTVKDIRDVPVAAWPAMVAHHHTEASVHNAVAYLGEYEEVDEHLATLLAHTSTFTDVADADQPERAWLATHVVQAGDTLGSAEKRVALAESLELSDPLPVTAITPESGELVGRLIKAGLLSDSAATFESSLILDWPSWEYASTQSASIIDAIAPSTLPATYLRDFFQSQRVSRELKSSVLADITSYVGAETADIRAAAQYAHAQRESLDYEQIEHLRANGARTTEVIELLAEARDLAAPDLRAVLREMGNPYNVIADHGTKRPLVTDDAAHIAILERLKAERVVKDHKPTKGGRRTTLYQP